MSAFALPRSLCILQSWLYIPHMLSGSSPSAAKHLLLHKRCEFVRMLMFISITFICLVRDSSHISAYSKVMRSAVLLPDSTYFWLKLDFALGHTDGWEIKGEKKTLTSTVKGSSGSVAVWVARHLSTCGRRWTSTKTSNKGTFFPSRRISGKWRITTEEHW